MTTTLTGPRSFKATLHRAEKRAKYINVVEVEAATYTFDASDAVSAAGQRALFKDYAATAKELGLVARKEAAPYGYSNLPNFTAAPMAKNERQWLGREVGFRPYASRHFAPVAGGTSSMGANMLHGVVWSLAPYPKCFWVYVEGQGFYSVAEGDLLTGVNA